MMKTIFVIRHADAVSRDNPDYAEEDRPLTDHGRQQAQALADAFQKHGLALDAIVCSPLLRTKQTAEEFAGHLTEPPLAISYDESLAPGGKSRKLFKHLRELDAEHVALVGHEPDLSELVARMIGSRRAKIKLAKGAIAVLECDDEPGKGCATLVGLIAPEWFGVPVQDEAMTTA